MKYRVRVRDMQEREVVLTNYSREFSMKVSIFGRIRFLLLGKKATFSVPNTRFKRTNRW